MSNFGKTVSLVGGAGTWLNALDVLIANGYTGFPILTGNLTESAGNAMRVKFGHTSRTVAPVSATDGFPLSAASEAFTDADFAVAWFYSAGTWELDIKASNGW